MTKSEYLESQRGKTYTQIVAGQPTEPVVGSIRGANLRNVVDILAKGLQRRLDNAPDSDLRTALLVVFRYLNLDDYQINLAIPENASLLQDAVMAELVTPSECAEFFKLATYQRTRYAITREDCAEYFAPGWAEIEQTDATAITLTLRARAPEMTHIVIQMRDPLGDWYHATAIHGVQAAWPYRVAVPYFGQPRKLRWRGEYALDGVVTAV